MSTNTKNRLITWLPLLLIIILAGVLRLYKLDKVPPSLSWDETAVGYNAFSIANWGTDEWGVKFPLVFRSFEDFKHPVHIYLTAVFVKLFGLSDFNVRLPAALFGVGSVILVYFLAKEFFKSRLAGLLAALLLAVSPYNLQFSRFNHELNFAVFFLMLGILLFSWGLRKKNNLLPLSFLSFGLSFISYHSAKVVVPPVVILLCLVNLKKLSSVKKQFLIGLGIIALTILMTVLNKDLLGLARIKQTSIQEREIVSTELYQKTNSQLLGRVEIVTTQYLKHFSPDYLFVSGDGNLRHSTGTVGEFYKIDLIFLLAGMVFLIWRLISKKDANMLILLVWALVGPLPAAATSEAPHAARAMFMTGSWHLIAAFGFYSLVTFPKNKLLRISLAVLGLAGVAYFLRGYLDYYYHVYPKKDAIQWQYGMREAIKYLKSQKAGAVYMTNVRQQPYIFFLYYLQTPTPVFQKTVRYNPTQSKTFSLVSSFGKYHFLDDLEFAYSYPGYGIYYVLTGPEYTGLYYKKDFEVKTRILYPDGSEAFYIVTAK